MIRLFCSYLLSIFFVTGGSGAPDSAWVVQQVQEKYNQTKDFRADFQQVTSIGSLGQSQRAQGRVYLKKPGMMRWEYEGPDEQLIISNGKMLWIYDPSLNQVIEQKWDQVYASKVPTLFLAGLGHLEKDFRILSQPSPTTVGNQPSVYLLKLIPKNRQLNLTELILTINPKNFLIEESWTKDNFDNTTSLVFSNIRINTGVPDTIFSFKPPKGVEKINTSDMLPNLQLNRDTRD
jgi:outer membrane lipoprotein carrier protein